MSFLYHQKIHGSAYFYLNAESRELDDSDPFVIAFKKSSFLKLKYFLNVDVLEFPYAVDKDLYYMAKYCSAFYMLPYGDLAAIRGFLLRSYHLLDKSYKVVSDGFPYLFGLHRLKAFKYNDPLFVCEGAKDSEVVSRISKIPCLATMGSVATVKQMEIIRKLTNRVVMIADGDKWGKRNIRKNKRRFGTAVNCIGFKDCGEFIDNSDKREIIRNFILNLKEIYFK
jgi:5S rRNA maturation endonuclease (ribonuclease M5)